MAATKAATVRVAVQGRDGLMTTAETDRAVRVAPGLAVTPAVGTEADGRVTFRKRGAWTVTHLASGTKLTADVLETKELAVAVAKELAKLTDWTLPAAALRKQRGLYIKVRRVRRLYGGTMR